MEIILASKSPRREKMLKDFGYNFTTIPSEFDESTINFEDPVSAVKKTALGKAKVVFENLPSKNEDLVIGADTIVVCDGKVLFKPKSEEEAKDMLKCLSSKVHQVYTAVALISKDETHIILGKTDVEFYELSDKEIEEYIATGEPMDKAGAYGIQGRGCEFVRKIDGDYFNVVGLPLPEVVRYLKTRGAYPQEGV